MTFHEELFNYFLLNCKTCEKLGSTQAFSKGHWDVTAAVLVISNYQNSATWFMRIGFKLHMYNDFFVDDMKLKL